MQDGARAAIQTGPEQTHTACVLHTGPYWAILDRTGPHWAILGATGPYWSILGHTGLYWTIQEHTGGYWALLGQPGGPPCLRQDTTLHGRPRLGRTHLTSPLHTSPCLLKFELNVKLKLKFVKVGEGLCKDSPEVTFDFESQSAISIESDTELAIVLETKPETQGL